jgi:hypothetical protein
LCIAACVLFGMIATLSLAWGPEVWRVVTWKPGTPVRTVNFITLESTAPDGQVYRASGYCDGIRGEEWILRPLVLTAPLEPRFDPGPRPKRSPPYWVAWPPSTPVQIGPSLPIVTLYGGSTHAWGWPMRSMRFSRITEYTHSEFSGTADIGVIPFVWRGERNDLPGRIIWPGMVVDVLFFSSACWLLVRGPTATRRWSRRRSGRCIACGYDRRGLPTPSACPECGRIC